MVVYLLKLVIFPFQIFIISFTNVSEKYAEFRILQPNFEENISEVNQIIKSKTNNSLYDSSYFVKN